MNQTSKPPLISFPELHHCRRSMEVPTKTKHVTHKFEAMHMNILSMKSTSKHPWSVQQSSTIQRDLWKYQDEAIIPGKPSIWKDTDSILRLTIASSAPSRKGLQYWKGDREREMEKYLASRNKFYGTSQIALRHLLYRSLSYIEIGNKSFFILCARDQQFTQELQYNISKLCGIVFPQLQYFKISKINNQTAQSKLQHSQHALGLPEKIQQCYMFLLEKFLTIKQAASFEMQDSNSHSWGLRWKNWWRTQ